MKLNNLPWHSLVSLFFMRLVFICTFDNYMVVIFLDLLKIFCHWFLPNLPSYEFTPDWGSRKLYGISNEAHLLVISLLSISTQVFEMHFTYGGYQGSIFAIQWLLSNQPNAAFVIQGKFQWITINHFRIFTTAKIEQFSNLTIQCANDRMTF